MRMVGRTSARRACARASVAAAAVAIVLLGWCGPLAAQPAVRARTAIDRDTVQLGDLFTGIDDPAKAATIVADAPAPGQKAQFDTPALTDIAASNGIVWTPASRNERAVVERQARLVDKSTLIAAIGRAMQAQGVGPAPGAQVEFVLDNEDQRISIGPGEAPTVAVESLSFDTRQQRFIAQVAAPANSPSATHARISGRLVASMDVPMPSHDLHPGDVIRVGDLEIHRMRADRVTTSVASDADKLIGRTVKRFVAAQQAIHLSDVAITFQVTKNSLVNVQVQSKAMLLVMQGKALDDGAIGDSVRVLNTHSNRTIQGTVVGPGAVTVLTATSIAAN